MPVFARVVRNVAVLTFSAGRHMPAECFGSTGLDRGHHFELTEADMPCIGLPPRRAICTKDVSDLQRVL